jgi:hypothetical protein
MMFGGGHFKKASINTPDEVGKSEPPRREFPEPDGT